MKKFALSCLALLLVVSMLPMALAHSGRTDSNGGHKDNKNVSGLGSYHYHHGYGPHLHPGGVCPYDSKPASTPSSTPSTTPSTTTAPASTPSTTTKPSAPVDNSAKATRTSSVVYINSEKKSFDAYNIGGNNYFKLRDLAYSLSGTERQFEVNYVHLNKSLLLYKNRAYTVVGGEMEISLITQTTVTPTESKIFIDNDQVSFTVYYIDGNNYFKLRDIGKAMNFGVAYDEDANAIVIDTSVEYRD